MGGSLCSLGETGEPMPTTEFLVQLLVEYSVFMVAVMYELFPLSTSLQLTGKTGKRDQKCSILYRTSSWYHYILYNGLYHLCKRKKIPKYPIQSIHSHIQAAILTDTGGLCECTSTTDPTCATDPAYATCLLDLNRNLITATAAISGVGSILMG